MKKRPSFHLPAMTRGTIAMLLVTAGVLAVCAVFMLAISGETLHSRADEVAWIIEETGASLPKEEGSFAAQARMRPTARPQQPAPTAAPTAVPQKAQESVTLTLAAAGTVYAPKAVRAGTQTETGEYDFSAVFAGLGDALSAADLAIATLETLTAGEDKGYGNYNAPAALLDSLRARGVDVISLGTEHALDKGYEGLLLTGGELVARGITHAGMRTGARRTDLLDVSGVKVAVLAYTYGLSDEGKALTNESERAAVSLIDAQRMTQDIRQARADGANVVIVLPHWGTKNKQETPEELRELARVLAAAGADVILGTHPNVVQGTERLRVTRADGLDYDTVVCYSLGTLLSDARTEENTAGMIAHLQITYDPHTRRISLGTLACSPVYIARQKNEGENVYRVIDAENAQAVQRLDEEGRAAAQRAAKLVREITGQSEMEGEGEG